MSRRKAFWGTRIKRPISGAVNGECLDCAVNAFGIQLIKRSNGQLLRLIPWAELHRLAQQSPLEQLGAAVAERGEPRILPVEDEK